jgi:hypothetical protein
MEKQFLTSILFISILTIGYSSDLFQKNVQISKDSLSKMYNSSPKSKIKKGSFHCIFTYGNKCGLGVLVFLKNTDVNHRYRVTIVESWNGVHPGSSQSIIDMNAGEERSLGCSVQNQNDHVWTITGESPLSK